MLLPEAVVEFRPYPVDGFGHVGVDRRLFERSHQQQIEARPPVEGAGHGLCAIGRGLDVAQQWADLMVEIPLEGGQIEPPFAAERLPNSKLAGELTSADGGQRLQLQLTSDAPVGPNVSLAGWVMAPRQPTARQQR